MQLHNKMSVGCVPHVAVVGQEIQDGRLVVKPEFSDYLKRKGVLK
jgi:hypothetical protein